MDKVLQVTKLSCAINDRQLFRPLSFALATGEALQIQGPNGSGKTTLVKTLSGMPTSYTGQFTLTAPLIFIGHQHLLHPDLSVRQNLQFLQADCVDSEYFGITRLLDQKSHALSVGQQQRVSLSRLLNTSAKLWLLDEPLANLDDHARGQLRFLCQRHINAGGALVMVTHEDIGLGTKICLT